MSKKEKNGCYGCRARVDASNRHVTPIWRNVYCDDDPDCRSLSEENDKNSPKWCPQRGYVMETQTEIGMYDRSKVQSVTIGVTIPLATPYSNIKTEITCDDAETCRRALIETLAVVLPVQSAVDRDLVNRYMKNILIR